jgi:GT2 family glycosyltransferase
MAETNVIGIVTVTYRSATILEPFLDSLDRQSYRNFALYAIDNASNDQSVCMLQEPRTFPVHVIANSKNEGVAEGNNQGIRAALAAGCEYILLMNNDTEFGPDLLEVLDRKIRAEHADMIVPKMLYYEPNDVIWCAGGTFRFWRGYSGEHYGMGERDAGQHDRMRRIEYAPTCCMLIRREVFTAIGEMDSRYFVYFDDTDFCFRAHRAGVRLLYVPEPKLYHKVSSLTGGDTTPFALRYLTRNHVYFLLKHFGYWAPIFLLAYKGQLWMKRIFGKMSKEAFAIVRQAFDEGVQLYRAA